MSSTTTSVSGAERLESIFAELSELTGQRNAIDGRIVDLVAEIDRDELWGSTGARSITALVAWKTGTSTATAKAIATVAHRRESFPQCTAAMRDGRLSLDQVGVIAARAADGSDAHYAALASVATVNQLRTAISLEPRPKPDPRPGPHPSITTTATDDVTIWRLTLPHAESAMLDAAIQSHRDALITDWKRDRDTHSGGSEEHSPPMPTTVDAFLRLIEAGWDSEAHLRPHGQRTTVVVHLDLAERIGALHLGPLLTDADRHYLTCDATCEVWFERDGTPIGSGRTTRTISRRLRRALEHRHRTCAVPGCTATRGLHAHHITHWEDGGPTELSNLVLLCPYHHRQHHNGTITITGPAEHLTITDQHGAPLTPGSLARTPQRPPPDVPPCRGPLGERADWWWYTPFQPQPPPSTN